MFVGRTRELGEIRAALARASTDRGSLFLLAGEPGIGKTRLANELAEGARDLGMVVVWGRCWEARGAPAFWPWMEAFSSLGVAFPNARSVTGASPAEARFALFREVTRALEDGARAAPVLLLLEDLHAADATSLQLLELVASRLHAMPVVVVGTFRDLEARLREESSEAIARLGRLGQVLHLPRLAASDVALLVRDAIETADEILVSSVFETTQGNPLFVAELVRDIRVHGLHDRLPHGVREVIRERLAMASAPLRETLEAAAVLGVEFAITDVARMIPESPARLDAAVHYGLLTAREGRLRFSHALYREALYHDLAHDRRQAIHRAAARALATSGAATSAIAHHLLEGGADVIAEGVEHAIVAAADAVDGFAFEDAIALLERARAALPGRDDTSLRCRILVAIGETKVRSGDVTGRQACVEAAAQARVIGDARLLGLAGLAYGAVFITGGVDPVLVEMLEQSLAGLPAEDSPERARVMARLAAARQPSSPERRPIDLRLALDAIHMARRVAGPRDRLDVLHAASGALYSAVDPIVRLPVATEHEQLAEELGNVTHLIHARVRLATDHLELGDLAAYAALADRNDTLVREIGPAATPWRVPLMRSTLAMMSDRFDESERWQDEARRLGDDTPRFRRALAFHRVGFLRTAERHAELRGVVAEIRGLWLGMTYGTILADTRVASCLAYVGDDEDVRTVAETLPDEVIGEQINTSSLADVLWSTADASMAARLLPLIEQTGDRCVMYWFDCEFALMPNARSHAFAAAVLGRWGDCDAPFARAMAMVERGGQRSRAARMRFELGDLFLRLEHDLPRARTMLAAARQEAMALGLDELVALIDRRHPPPTIVAPRPSGGAAPTFAMRREGEYYAVTGTRGQVLRFKAVRGMQYLAALVDQPNRDVHVLDLVGSSSADRSDAGEVVDASALRAYKDRLTRLRDAVELAEELGDAERAERARAEMEQIAAELRRSTSRGRRTRRTSSAVDRARSAVQRRIKDALERIAAADAELGAWLRRSVTTGNHCKFRPGA